MRYEKAKRIVQMLADGKSPKDGKPLAANDSCNNPAVIRALFSLLQMCDDGQIEEADRLNKKVEKNINNKPNNAGMPWSEKDKMEVCRMFQGGTNPKKIADHFGRSLGSINSLLNQKGYVSDEKIKSDIYG